MSTNCLVTKLKGSVNNDNLLPLGMTFIEVDTTGISTEFGRLGFVNNIDYVYIVGDGTFLDGTKEKRNLSINYVDIASNTKLKIAVPKYPNMPLLTKSSTDNIISKVNVDDLVYADNYKGTGSSIELVNRKGIIGDFTAIISKYPNTKSINIGGTGMTFDLYSESINKDLELLVLTGLNINGTVEDFATNFIHGNAEHFKARTNTLLLTLYNTNVTFNNKKFDHAVNRRSIFMHFNGTAIINVYFNSAETLNAGTYNIDTDVWTYYEN